MWVNYWWWQSLVGCGFWTLAHEVSTSLSSALSPSIPRKLLNEQLTPGCIYPLCLPRFASPCKQYRATTISHSPRRRLPKLRVGHLTHPGHFVSRDPAVPSWTDWTVRPGWAQHAFSAYVGKPCYWIHAPLPRPCSLLWLALLAQHASYVKHTFSPSLRLESS
jgi:hypothetical protein